jgi:hypothetical protein
MKRIGWFVHDALSAMGEMAMATSTISFVIGVCLLGPPLPTESAEIRHGLLIALTAFGVGAIALWCGLLLTDPNTIRFWLRLRLEYGRTVSIRGVLFATRELKRAHIVGWRPRYVASVIIPLITGERGRPESNGACIAWDSYCRYTKRVH